MEQLAERIKQVQADINRRRSSDRKPPVDDFMTVEFANGFVTMSIKEFNRQSKAKKNKLLKGRRTV